MTAAEYRARQNARRREHLHASERFDSDHYADVLRARGFYRPSWRPMRYAVGIRQYRRFRNLGAAVLCFAIALYVALVLLGAW